MFRYSAPPTCPGLAEYRSAVLQVPLSDVSDTFGKNGQPSGSVVGVQSQTELRVIRVGLLMVLYAVACDDVGYRTAVDGEQ